MEAPLGVNQVPLEPTKGSGSQPRPLGARRQFMTFLPVLDSQLVGDASGAEICCIFTLGAEVAFYRIVSKSRVGQLGPVRWMRRLCRLYDRTMFSVRLTSADLSNAVGRSS